MSELLGKLSVREKNLIIILLIVVLFEAAYLQFFKLFEPKYIALSNELKIKEHELESAKKMISMIEQLKKENGVLKQRITGAKTKYNYDIRNGLSYYFIGKYAEKNLVTVITIVPQPMGVKKHFLTIPVSIAVRGKYQDIQRFINALEQEMPNTTEIAFLFIEPEGLSLSKTQTEQDGGEDNTGLYQSSAIMGQKDPDIIVSMELITYLTRSPETMELAENLILGREDAFSPAVSLQENAYTILNDGFINEQGKSYFDNLKQEVGDSDLPDKISEEGHKFPVGNVSENASSQDSIKQELSYCFPHRNKTCKN